MKTKPKLKDYEGLINKQSWVYARKYLLDFEDVRSQAFVIFCEALQKYDDRHASFTTYLWHQLRALETWCWDEKRVRWFLSDSISEEYPMTKSPPKIDLGELGLDAAEIVRRITYGEFYDPNRLSYKSGSRTTVAKTLKWNPDRFDDAWTEAKGWWKDFSQNPL